MRYYIDNLVTQTTPQHEVLRLPPYHPQYNPIELVWGITKRDFDDNVGLNHKYDEESTRRTWENALSKVTPHVWEKCCQHAEKIILNDYYQHGLDKTGILLEDAVTQHIGNDVRNVSEIEASTIAEINEISVDPACESLLNDFEMVSQDRSVVYNAMYYNVNFICLQFVDDSLCDLPMMSNITESVPDETQPAANERTNSVRRSLLDQFDKVCLMT